MQMFTLHPCPIKTPFLLASSHHQPTMNFYYTFLLLLVVLSTYSVSFQYFKLPGPTSVIVCPNSSSVQLGTLAPVLPQNEVFEYVLLQIGVFQAVLSQHERFQVVFCFYVFILKLISFSTKPKKKTGLVDETAYALGTYPGHSLD